MSDSSVVVSQQTNAVLVIGHPGHELRVFRWVEQNRPIVCVLTDGSGSAGVSRVESTRRVVESAGARLGPWQGRVRDADVYQWLLSGTHGRFQSLVDELTGILASSNGQIVAADAAEGFNPAHDVCRLIVNAAVARLSLLGRDIDSYEFALDRAPTASPCKIPQQVHVTLDDEALERKLRAAQNYPELQSEVARALAAYGRDAFRTEYLSRVDHPFDLASQYEGPPAYERYGAERVAAGIYSTTITYSDHVAPLLQALGSQP